MVSRTRRWWGVGGSVVWLCGTVAAHGIHDSWGTIVFLVGILGVVLCQVIPRLRTVLRATAADVEAWRLRWRRARAEAAAAFAWPPWLKLLWYVAALLFLVCALLWLMAPDGALGQLVMSVAWDFLIVVATVDLMSWVRVALRRPMGRAAGIAFVSVGTVLVAAIALSFARKTVFAWMGEDPGAFPASLTVFTAALIPFGWLLLIAFVSAVLMFPMLLASLAQMGNTDRLDREGGFHTFLVSLRPVLLCAVPMFFASQVWSMRPRDWQPLRYAGTVMVLALDYWERPICGGSPGLAVRLDDTHYSLFAGEKNALRFRTVTCKGTAP